MAKENGKKLLNLLSFGHTERSENYGIVKTCEKTSINDGKSIYEQAKELIEAGADLSAKDRDGRTALHKAAHHGYSGIVGLLIDNKASIDAKDKKGHTPLLDAVRGKNEGFNKDNQKEYDPIIRQLLISGAKTPSDKKYQKYSEKIEDERTRLNKDISTAL